MIGAVLLLAGTLNADGQLLLRGTEPAPEAVVLRVDPDGVLVRWPNRSPATEVLPLSRVRYVWQSEQGAWSDVASAAESLWRADSRLRRGDFVSAEPIFEQLFASYRSRPGPTGLVVAEGLLRCRLARHAHAAAIDPWIAWLSCGGAGQSTDDREAALIGPSVTLNSRNIRLFAALPPIWLKGPSTQAIAEQGESLPLAEEVPPAIRHLRDLYATAAAFEMDGVEREITVQTGGDPILAFVREIVASRVGKSAAREAARESLERRLGAEGPGWLHAWCRVAIARSYLREPEIEDQRRAILGLISVHAFHSGDSPYLAGVALAEAARACEAIGDARASLALWQELVDRYPGHPATDPGIARTLRSDVSRVHDATTLDAPNEVTEDLPEGGAEGGG